jgi:hypothetical protein
LTPVGPSIVESFEAASRRNKASTTSTSMLRLFSNCSPVRVALSVQNPAKKALCCGVRLSSTISQLLHPDPASPSPSSPRSLTVNGFVRSIRKQKRVAFATIGDGSSLEALQAVLTPDQAKGYVNDTKCGT